MGWLAGWGAAVRREGESGEVVVPPPPAAGNNGERRMLCTGPESLITDVDGLAPPDDGGWRKKHKVSASH